MEPRNRPRCGALCDSTIHHQGEGRPFTKLLWNKGLAIKNIKTQLSKVMTEKVRIPIHQKRVSKKCEPQGTPWWSRGEDSLSLPRAQAQPLAGERRSCKQSGMISHPPFQN